MELAKRRALQLFPATVEMDCVRLNEGELGSRNKWIKTRKSAHSSEIVSVA